MRAPAKPQKKSNLPLLLGGGAALLLIVLLTGGGDSSTSSTTTTHPKRKTTKDDGIFLPEDHTAHFASFNTGAVDVFKPLVRRTVALPIDKNAASAGKGSIPANFTGGEGNWYYTGIVELNGQTQALLENTTSGETVYVSPGEAFKAARVRSVDVATVVLTGPDGTTVSVPIQQYGEAAGGKAGPAVASNLSPLPAAGGAPIAGAIGALPNATLRPTNGPIRATLANGQTIELNSIDGAAAQPANGNPYGGRRRRRNRNTDQGTLGAPTNVP